MRIFAPAFLLLVLAVSGCSNSTDATINITPQYKDNISTLFAQGGPLGNRDSTGSYPATDFSWKDSLGMLHSLSELKGNVVVVNFWATWCVPCINEMPDLQQVSEDYDGDSAIVIGIANDQTGDEFKNVNDFVKRYKYSYQFIVDPNYQIYKNYSLSGGIPWTVYIDKTGHIRHVSEGTKNRVDFETEIDSLM